MSGARAACGPHENIGVSGENSKIMRKKNAKAQDISAPETWKWLRSRRERRAACAKGEAERRKRNGSKLFAIIWKAKNETLLKSWRISINAQYHENLYRREANRWRAKKAERNSWKLSVKMKRNVKVMYYINVSVSIENEISNQLKPAHQLYLKLSKRQPKWRSWSS